LHRLDIHIVSGKVLQIVNKGLNMNFMKLIIPMIGAGLLLASTQAQACHATNHAFKKNAQDVSAAPIENNTFGAIKRTHKFGLQKKVGTIENHGCKHQKPKILSAPNKAG